MPQEIPTLDFSAEPLPHYRRTLERLDAFIAMCEIYASLHNSEAVVAVTLMMLALETLAQRIVGVEVPREVVPEMREKLLRATSLIKGSQHGTDVQMLMEPSVRVLTLTVDWLDRNYPT